jgi:hypothetical protein
MAIILLTKLIPHRRPTAQMSLLLFLSGKKNHGLIKPCCRYHLYKLFKVVLVRSLSPMIELVIYPISCKFSGLREWRSSTDTRRTSFANQFSSWKKQTEAPQLVQ